MLEEFVKPVLLKLAVYSHDNLSLGGWLPTQPSASFSGGGA